MFGGAARCFDGGAACAVELWPGFCGGVAARGAWRVGGCCAALAKSWSARRNFGRDLTGAGERGIMGGGSPLNTKNTQTKN